MMIWNGLHNGYAGTKLSGKNVTGRVHIETSSRIIVVVCVSACVRVLTSIKRMIVVVL